MSAGCVTMGGSPPLARGTVCTATAQIPLAGITPACAGNSGCSAGVTPSRWDHPRLRGEQNVNFPRQQHKRGSPPLARGTVSSSAACVVGTWITPACAGNSKRGEKRVETHRDHPRLRGEQTKKRLVVPCILQYRFSFFNQFFVDIFC